MTETAVILSAATRPAFACIRTPEAAASNAENPCAKYPPINPDLENRITSIATEQAKSTLSRDKAMDIIANRASISPAVEEVIKEAVGEEYYVNIVTVVLTDIDFSDAFELAVEEKMIAEQTKLKADYENETKIAKAEADVNIARAEAEALLVKAEAEAEANNTINKSLTENVLEKMMLDKWNGELPTVTGGEGNYMLPSDILE